MAYDATGKWTPEDDSVSTKLNGLLSQTSPLMEQAKTSGLQLANKRGLANSSMAVGASQDAVIKSALPIASQEAQQTYGKNITGMTNKNQQDIAGMNIAANERDKAMAGLAAFENSYTEATRTISQATNLSADARNKLLAHYAANRDSNINLVEQLYNVDLQWATPSVVTS